MSNVVIAAEKAVEGVATGLLSGLSWLPWAIAGASLIIGAGGTLWYRSEWQGCVASIATEAAKAEAMVNAAKAADANLRRHLEEQLAPVAKAIQDQAQATQIALAKVPSNPGCARTPAAAAFDAGVRQGKK